jgi:hypothetical protein
MVFYRLAENFPEPIPQHCLPQLMTLSGAVQGTEVEEP